jgi:2Fe-2S ferredoxin
MAGAKALNMPTLQITNRAGVTTRINADAGVTLKQAIAAGGVSEIEALTSCGGFCSCGTCHVLVNAEDFARLPPMKPDEDGLLDFADTRTQYSRLSCQITLTDALDGLRATVAPPL